jgi:hypothetical protein
MHTCTSPETYAFMYAYMHESRNIRIHVCIHARVQKHTHKIHFLSVDGINPHTHTHTHTHIYTAYTHNINFLSSATESIHTHMHTYTHVHSIHTCIPFYHHRPNHPPHTFTHTREVHGGYVSSVKHCTTYWCICVCVHVHGIHTCIPFYHHRPNHPHRS